ncbi:hypothetical protein EHYA_09598 [Embleya hyalina]|uniref:Uncharacterized protein n=1 Tax=Embleya hyalina TaxID=516124 RepID=A0A401Z4Q3_9ACTN|nr:hypothetical protein EHYA_09598 [Embleya hyalina]
MSRTRDGTTHDPSCRRCLRDPELPLVTAHTNDAVSIRKRRVAAPGVHARFIVSLRIHDVRHLLRLPAGRRCTPTPIRRQGELVAVSESSGASLSRNRILAVPAVVADVQGRAFAASRRSTAVSPVSPPATGGRVSTRTVKARRSRRSEPSARSGSAELGRGRRSGQSGVVRNMFGTVRNTAPAWTAARNTDAIRRRNDGSRPGRRRPLGLRTRVRARPHLGVVPRPHPPGGRGGRSPSTARLAITQETSHVAQNRTVHRHHRDGRVAHSPIFCPHTRNPWGFP